MAGALVGKYVYSDTDPAANAPSLLPNARVAMRPSWIVGSVAAPIAVEGSMIMETSVPAVATTNTIANSYEGFNIYEAAQKKQVHSFGKNFDGPNNYTVYILVQNIYDTPRNVTLKLFGKTPTSPGHGATRTVDIPPFGTLKVRPSEIAGGIDFSGSVVVYSNLAVAEDGLGPAIPAMNRYECAISTLPLEAMSIYDSTVPQPSLSFPFLKDGTFGGAIDYQNYLSVINPNTVDATVSVILYDNNGSEQGRLANYVIGAGGKVTWRPSWIRGTTAAPVDFEGSIYVISNVDVVGQTNVLYPGMNLVGVDAFNLYEASLPTNSLFFPKAYDNRLAGNHMVDNYGYISNHDTVPKTITIQQFNNDGTINGTRTVTLNPNATYVWRPMTLVTDGSGNFRGSVRVTEANGLNITGVFRYELHQGAFTNSLIDCMTVYRSMGN